MNAIVEDHRRACRGFTDAVTAAEGRWSAESPCPGWDARAVVEHVIGFHDVLILRPRGAKPARPPDDVAARWAVTVEALSSVLTDPANLDDGLLDLLPMLTTDVVVHTWDLSRAAGSSVTLDVDLCRSGYDRAVKQPLHERAPGMFAPSVPVDSAATVVDRLVARYGRDPRWVATAPVAGGSDRGLLAAQYATGANLAARVSIYRYLEAGSDPGEGLHAWVVDHAEWRSGLRAVDVGCGPGPYVVELCRRAAVVAAVDLSVGMLREARSRAPDGSAVAAVAGDASQLPLADESVDVLLAAHMLYHLPDIDRAVAELRRVLRPGGTLLVVLNGSIDKHEMRDLWRAAADRAGKPFDPPWWSARANLDNVPARLTSHFSAVSVDRLPGVFRFPSSAPPMLWVEALRAGTEGVLDDDAWTAVGEELRQSIDAVIAREGELRVTKESGVVVAR